MFTSPTRKGKPSTEMLFTPLSASHASGPSCSCSPAACKHKEKESSDCASVTGSLFSPLRGLSLCSWSPSGFLRTPPSILRKRQAVAAAEVENFHPMMNQSLNSSTISAASIASSMNVTTPPHHPSNRQRRTDGFTTPVSVPRKRHDFSLKASKLAEYNAVASLQSLSTPVRSSPAAGFPDTSVFPSASKPVAAAGGSAIPFETHSTPRSSPAAQSSASSASVATAASTLSAVGGSQESKHDLSIAVSAQPLLIGNGHSNGISAVIAFQPSPQVSPTGSVVKFDMTGSISALEGLEPLTSSPMRLQSSPMHTRSIVQNDFISPLRGSKRGAVEPFSPGFPGAAHLNVRLFVLWCL